MRLFSCFFFVGLLAWLPSTHAQTETHPSADTPVWQVNLNVSRLFESPLGKLINEIIAQESGEKELDIDAFIEALGFDPRTSVGEVKIFGETFEPTSVSAIANLGSARGNIEGWLLAAPGYQSEEVGNTIIHSVEVDKDKIKRVWCAIPQQVSTKDFILVAGFNADRVRELVSRVSGETQSDMLADDKFLSLAVNDLSKAPIDIDDDDPGSAIIKTIQSVALSVGTEGDQLTSQCEITTDSAARAQQLNQLLVGMKAMAQLALPQKEPEVKEFMKYLDGLKVEYEEGSQMVAANFAIEYEVIDRLIKEKTLK